MDAYARAARLAGHPDEALGFARQSVVVAPRFARAQVELARQHALLRDHEAALAGIRQAFALHPRSLREVFADPAFRPMRSDIDTLVQDLKAKIARDVSDLGRAEAEIARLCGKAPGEMKLEDKTITRLIEAGRQSVRRQYERVCTLVEEAERKMREMEAEVPKLPPATQESLNFKYAGRAMIVEWFKQPGDVIQPDEAVYSYQYEGSTKVIPRPLRGRMAVRMTKRVGGSGVWVSSEQPYVFEHIPASVQIPEPNRLQRMRAAIENSERQVEAASKRLTEIQADEENMRTSLAVPGIRWLATGAVAAAIGLLLVFVMGRWGYGAMLIGAAAYLTIKGHEGRNALARLVQEREQAENGLAEHEGTLQSRREEMSALEAACAEAKTRAREALDRFEGLSLRKGGRLLPFPSIFGAREGDVVRVCDRQMERFKNESEREIEIREDLPEWLYGEGMTKSKTGLLRVVEAAPGRLALSHRSAYQQTREDQ